MSERPFRDLCSEADYRDSLSDSELWDYLYPTPVVEDPAFDSPSIEQFDGQPCPECGEAGACGYDDQGREMIHAIYRDEADES